MDDLGSTLPPRVEGEKNPESYPVISTHLHTETTHMHIHTNNNDNGNNNDNEDNE